MPMAPNGSMQQPSMSQEGGMRMPQQPMQQEGGMRMPQQPMQQEGGIPMHAPMPPMQGVARVERRESRGRSRWKERLLGGNNAQPLTKQQERSIPQWLTGKAMVFFFVAMIACWMVFGYIPAFELWLTASVSVIIFCYGGFSMAKSWSLTKEKAFLRKIFIAGFVVRLLWVLYCYFFFNHEYYGTNFGDSADVSWYMPFGEAIANWIRGEIQMTFSQLINTWSAAIDDVGYPIWLAIINLITFGKSDVFVPFVVKCIVGAYCGICIYHVAKRHFGEGAARMSAVFVALNPNMIYWCGNMFKEAELVFVCCLCVDLVDKTFSSGAKLSFRGLLPGIFAGMALFFFRTALGMVMFLAMFAHIIMASNRVMSMGKKVIAGVLVAATLLVGMGNRVRTQTEKVVNLVQSDSQKRNIEWRSNAKTGNVLAKYASAAVFAPLIFTIPFPTFNVSNEAQILQHQLSGGNYIKNILSFFVIYVMIIMLLSGEWRQHVFILAYTCGYEACLVLSNFAHSSRFHMPIWPMLMLFAAYGIQIAKGNAKLRRGFTWVLAAEVVVCLAWNWFKLRGRGLV